MNLNPEDKFFKEIKHTLRSHEFDYEPTHWTELSARLSQKPANRLGGALFYNFIGVCMASLIVWAFWQQNTPAEVQSLVKQEVLEQKAQSHQSPTASIAETMQNILQNAAKTQLKCKTPRASTRTDAPILAQANQTKVNSPITSFGSTITAKDRPKDEKMGVILKNEFLVNKKDAVISNANKNILVNRLKDDNPPGMILLESMSFLPLATKPVSEKLRALPTHEPHNNTKKQAKKLGIGLFTETALTQNTLPKYYLQPSYNVQLGAGAGANLQYSLWVFSPKSDLKANFGLTYSYTRTKHEALYVPRKIVRRTELNAHWLKIPLGISWSYGHFGIGSSAAYQLPIAQSGNYWSASALSEGGEVFLNRQMAFDKGFWSIEGLASYQISSKWALQVYYDLALNDAEIDAATYWRINNTGLRLLYQVR